MAPGRRRRPHQASGEVRGVSSSSCPLCPGREAETPREVLRLPPEDGNPWAVRVVPNKFAVLSPEQGGPEERCEGMLFRERDGVGYHELVVDSAHHDRRIAEMSGGEVALILDAYHDRYRELRNDARVAYIVVFKNVGSRAGASLQHPHSQIVAVPMAPRSLEQRYARARAYHDETKRCLYCDMVEAEREAATRMVGETDRFVAFCPFASGVPFETWIAPKAHQPSFGATSRADRLELGELLRSSLRRADEALGRPDFNYVLHTAPVSEENEPYYLWHLQILPRTTTLAGFELGSGIPINTTLPEDAAAALRSAEGSEWGH